MNVKTRMVCGIVAAAAAWPAAAQVYEGRAPGVVQERDLWWQGYTAEHSDDLRVLGQPESRGPDLYDWAYDYMYDDYFDFDEFPEHQRQDRTLGTLDRPLPERERRVYGTESRIYATDEWTPRTGEVREYGGVPRYTDRAGAVRTATVYENSGEYGIWSDDDEGAERVYLTDDRDFEVWYDAD